MQIHGGEGKTKDIRVDFSVNINPLGMPASVQSAFQSLAAAPSALEVYPDRSCKGLRRAAAEHYRVPEDWIVCGCGASELIYKIAYLYRGSRALVISPGFGEYEKALREAECKVRTLELKEERGFVFDGEFLERFCRTVEAEKPRLVFLCSPNNPVGGRIPVAMLKTMLDFCGRRGVRAVVDECFLPFVTGEEPTVTFLKESAVAEADTQEGFVSCRQRGEVNSVREEYVGGCPIILKALTKSHAIPGVRLGLAISADTKLIRELQDAGAPWTVSGIAAKLGEAAFDGWDEKEFDAMRNMVAGERAYLESGLTKVGAKVYFGEGNFILFSVPAGENLFDFMRSRGILIRSCESFGLGKDFYRIAVRTREENKYFLEEYASYVETPTPRVPNR